MAGSPDENIAFPATRWSLIGRVGAPTSPDQRAALEAMLRRYLPALRAHLVLERRIDPESAEDLLQSFISGKLLEQRLIDHFEPGRGKFRTFILRALNHYLIDQYRRDSTARRMPANGPPMSIDAEFDVTDPSAAQCGASAEFDREWARQVLSEAVNRMHSECERTNRPDVWGVFEGRILNPCMHGTDPDSYESLLTRFRFVSPVQASNVLITAKRAFARHLRSVVGEYAAHDDDVERELAELKVILSGS